MILYVGGGNNAYIRTRRDTSEILANLYIGCFRRFPYFFKF